MSRRKRVMCWKTYVLSRSKVEVIAPFTKDMHRKTVSTYLRSANSTTIKCRRKRAWGSSSRKSDTNDEYTLWRIEYNCMLYMPCIMCIYCCLYTFVIADSARGRVQNVQRCRCRVSGVRNQCINNRAHSPRTCWRPRCPAP